MSQVKAVLQAARNLVDYGWTQHSAAVDAVGNYVDATDRAACKWCATGALDAAPGTGEARSKARAVLASVIRDGIVTYNDFVGRTKDQVLAKFDQAIAAA